MKYLLALILSVFVINCSKSDTTSSNELSSDDENNVEIEGMIHLERGTVTIGSNDKKFKSNERPAMEVKLSYDFYMDIHEVTCGEYAKVAKKAKLKSFGKCENDSLPLVDITYYDALLYANAKSKLEKYDTAYTYSKAIYDNSGHCTDLEGFVFQSKANAFRLPTEAEWVYAATRAWNVKKSWNNTNSNYELHPVCSIKADSAGFCDMAGNAMEWVNDWLGAFRSTTVTNYAGAPDGGNMGERVVKGGSYSSSEKEINPYSRGDVYTVTSATRAEYVGFRLAFGSIPHALWMSEDGKIASNIVTPLVSSETIKTLIGTYNVKLVFRNDISQNISYLDYQNGTLAIKDITENIDAYHPEISPNGNWVAFCTGMEGISGKSTLYVQSLEEDEEGESTENKNRQSLKVESAVIPRWRVLENGDTVIVYVTDAINNKDDATFMSASTWQVKFMNGKFGKPQKLFDGIFHGGISEDNTLAVTGARLFRARIAKSGSTVTEKASNVIWYDSAQACNVSLAQDGTKRTAFLDFSGEPGRIFAGESYSSHERIFIADSTGKLIQSIKAPATSSFDHTEWTTDGEQSFIIATLANINGAHTKIVIVNPADNSITELLSGEELWHPNLWIKKKAAKQNTGKQEINSSNSQNTEKTLSSESTTPPEPEFEFDADSAGYYYNSTGDYVAARWRYKMELLWQYKDTANVVILGSSRSLLGINPLEFKNPFYTVNLANSENTKYGSKYIFHNYVIPHFKKLKYVIISIDLDRWYHDDNYNFFYDRYKNFPGYLYDANHDFWVGKNASNLYNITYESIGNATYGKKLRQTRGYQTTAAGGWEQDKVPVKKDSLWYKKDTTVYYKNFKYLVEMIDEAASHGITVIGVECPESPAYKKTGSYGKYGLLRSQMPALLQEMNDISLTHPNFIFVDENKMGDHDYTDDMAQNADHLATLGATKLSQRLDSLLRTIE